MAAQVVVWSVLLFAMSGVVLDFGRVYSEHSRMQSFTDQAALAAASELDENTDSITRAVQAVFGGGAFTPMTRAADFSEGDGNQFGISHLIFLRDLGDDVGTQTNMGSDIGVNTLAVAFSDGSTNPSNTDELEAAAANARYVVAVAEERSVRNSLMQLVNSAPGNATADTNAVRTIAAARRRALNCGPLSNLVICNPWENDPDQSFESVLNNPNNEGMQFRHVADGQMDASTGALTAANSLARRLELEGPAAVRQICYDNASLPGFNGSMSSAQVEMARTICMMASAVQEDFCVGDEVEYVAAEPEAVTTALNTAFDLWDEPINGVLDWDLDSAGLHSQEVEALGATFVPSHPLYASSALFQPDNNIVKARQFDPVVADANAALGIPASSRLNYPQDSNYNHYDLILTTCLELGNAGTCASDSQGSLFLDGSGAPYLSAPMDATRIAEYYLTNYGPLAFGGFLPPSDGSWSTAYIAYGLEDSGWTHAPSGFTAFNPGTGLVTNFVQGQPLARMGSDRDDPLNPGTPADPRIPPTATDTSLVNLSGEDGTLATPYSHPLSNNDLLDRPVVDIATNMYVVDSDGALVGAPVYPNYTYQDFDIDLERRVIDVTVVNCGTASVGDNGNTSAEVVGFAKMHLLQTPSVECPDGTEFCANSQISTSTVHTEFIELTDMNESAYAVLVR